MIRNNKCFFGSKRAIALALAASIPLAVVSFQVGTGPLKFPSSTQMGNPAFRSRPIAGEHLKMQNPATSVLNHSSLTPQTENIEDENDEVLVAGDVSKTKASKVQNKRVTREHPIFQQTLKHMRNSLHKHGVTPQKVLSLMAAAVFMMATLFSPSAALAAPTGGRMGGSFGGSSRSSSAPTSRSYSSPGGYSRGFSQGYSTGYSSRPSVSISPFGGFGYSPFFRPAPVIYPGAGIGVISRGPSVFDVFFFGVFAWILLQVASAFTRPRDNPTFFDNANGDSVLGRGVSVAQISVALNVPNRDDRNCVLSYLDRLSETAKTDSRVGVSNLVSQVALELLRQKRSIFAANTSFKSYRSADDAQRNFNSIAFKERSKFERETVNKYGGVDYAGQERDTSLSGLSKATVAVVTIIIAIDGDSTKVPAINSISDVEAALAQIASDVKLDGSLRSAEVLWTPEQRDDTLSERDVFVDYPELRTI